MASNRIAFTVAAASMGIVILWTVFALTPSSYGIVLASLGAEDTGVLAGQPRPIRMDEWAVLTPYFQAAVRNGFERFNHTSFYGEDLRNINALPLRDWGIIFKPQFWAFFVLPPANALGLYFGVLMAAFLAGYFFLFRELNFGPEYALAGSLLLFCSGFAQFWWTTNGPSLSLFPWVALAVLRPCPWLVRLPVLAYACATWVIACAYPILIFTGGFGLAVLVLALRSETLRPGRRLAATVAGVTLGAGVVYGYYADLIPAFTHSVYPGLRRSPPGTVPLAILVSQFWPAFTFTASDFRELLGQNICEIAAAGSFFPILTICALDYSRLRRSVFDAADRGMWRSLAIIAAGAGLATWWMAGSCPRWIGRLFYWDHYTANRLLFLAGVLLVTAALIPWQRGMVAITPLRAAIFVALGPVASAVFKMRVFGIPAAQMKVDWVCVGVAAACVLGTIGVSRPLAARMMLCAVVGINALLFLRFNPLQSAYAIFDVPESIVLDRLTADQSNTPGHYLAVDGYPGATLNGFGLRSVSHVLIRPQPESFRQYFPNMARDAFDGVFNRFAWIRLKEVAVPSSPYNDEIDLPLEVFRPIRNLRRAVMEPGDPRCAGKPDAILGTPANTFGLSSSGNGPDLVVEGWAPWIGESAQQTLHIVTNRPIVARSLVTLRRPDVAEALHNYRMEKAGFRLTLSARDDRPLSLKDLRIAADGTLNGRTWIDGCAAQ